MISTPTVHLLSEQGDSLREQLATIVRGTGWEAARHDSAEDFLKRYRLDQHGCLLVAPGRHGPLPALELIRSLRERWLNLPVLLTANNSEPHSLEVAAVHGGAFDVIRCPAADASIRGQLARALDYDRQGSGLPALVRSRLAALSPKEREVLELTLEGQSTNAMASQLDVCYQTVNKHRARVRLKMRAKCDMVLSNALRGEPPLPHECGYTGTIAGAAPSTSSARQSPAGTPAPQNMPAPHINFSSSQPLATRETS